MSKINICLALDNIEEKIGQIHALIQSKPHLREFADTIHPIPRIYYGGGKIKLIVIGQDPTIINNASRKRITTVLNLDKPGKMQRYIFSVCEKLGIDPVKELYATNLYKNFFDEPPHYSAEVMKKFFDLWFPILKEEVSLFPDVPIITKGDHVLETLLAEKKDRCVRNYWGFTEDWRIGIGLPYKYVLPNENSLGRVIFPFPHEPNYFREFYVQRCESYLEHVKKNIFNEQYAAA